MLSELLYSLYPYQIFRSVFFRSGMAYLTTYFIIMFVMPVIIRLFRRKGITSDFVARESSEGPYQGATPIMGGVILIPTIIVSTLLWTWLNQYTISLLIILFSFAGVGLIDDLAKIQHKRRILAGKEEKKSYTDKADGISGKLRLGLEIGISSFVVLGLYMFVDGIDGHLSVPMIPMKTWFPYLPRYIFIPFMVFVIVGGANAVNLTDGLDSLATVPLMTCALFVAAVAYISGDAELSAKLKIHFISSDVKEVSIFAIAVIAAGIAFLRFNSPPASIYMGDVGSLGLGAVISTMFIFVKAELYLPIVGGIFVLAALSAIIQRIWFKLALRKKGRQWAEKNRFFYRAPYHHHQQMMMTYFEEMPINSIWHRCLNKIGLKHVPDEEKYLSRDNVNNKVIWRSHLRAIMLLVLSMIIFFKVR